MEGCGRVWVCKRSSWQLLVEQVWGDAGGAGAAVAEEEISAAACRPDGRLLGHGQAGVHCVPGWFPRTHSGFPMASDGGGGLGGHWILGWRKDNKASHRERRHSRGPAGRKREKGEGWRTVVLCGCPSQPS